MNAKSALYQIIGALLFATACLLFSTAVLAGELTEYLKTEISQSSNDEFVRVIIVPVSNFNMAVYRVSLKQKYTNRSERQVAAIARLKEVAEQSQNALRPELNILRKAGVAKNVKYYWIDNLIEAEIKANHLRDLSYHSNIEIIELYPDVVSIPNEKGNISLKAAAGPESNLIAVRADSAWTLGYDGNGRIVCSFDSGVDGYHPALSGNYRGNKGYPSRACWFTPLDNSTYPHHYDEAGSSREHGTHTTGIIVGRDEITGDTIGVAPGADWIAALAIDVQGASIIEAFQWAADPDGDPNTVTDIPDVINHSYGIKKIGCSQIFWGMIDNLEDGLGVVSVFSVGNEGTAIDATRSPGNRADDSITNFAIGAINALDSTIFSGSSRGPSDCDDVSIKPNVVAPGFQVRSCEPGGVYVSQTGTSAAAPHVSGAVAILRQKNPDASADQIKTALLNSAHDLGNAGPDNNYGWGLIDIVRALEEIDTLTEPSLQIHSLEYDRIDPGDNINLDLILKNIGTDAVGVLASFSNPETGLTLTTGDISFNSISKNSVVIGNSRLGISFAGDLETNRYYTLDISITAIGGYGYSRTLYFFVGEHGERGYYNHENPKIAFTISNYGSYGFHDDSYTELGYSGFQFGGTTNDLWESAFLLGTDTSHVSDGAHNAAQELDNDFTVSPGGSLKYTLSGRYADQETESYFDDSYAEHPLGVSVRQSSFIWNSPPDDEFVILRYIITNNNLTSINGLYVGMYFDWDLNVYSKNHGSFVTGEDLGYMCWASSTGEPDSSHFRGVRALNPEGLANHEILIGPTETYDTFFSEERKYTGLAISHRPSYASLTDVSHITSTGPFNLLPGQTDTAAFAVIAGTTWDEFIANAQNAQAKYNWLPTDAEDNSPVLPGKFALNQNYPNPFNPSTAFSFTLPKAGNVNVSIFDILGRSVKTYGSRKYQAGEHTISWDGTNDNGKAVSTGIYFYRLTFDNSSLTRKMILLK